jgi:tetratricopeptide (TPR) repeat protein
VLGMFSYKESLDFFKKSELYANNDNEFKSRIYDEITLLNLNEEYEIQLEFAKKAIEYNPNNAYYHLHIAKIKSMLELYDDALKHYEKAIELNPSESLFYKGLGDFYRIRNNKMKNLELAKINYKKAIKLRDNVDKYYNDLGELLYENKEYKDALINLRLGLKLFTHSESFNNIFDIYDESMKNESEKEIILQIMEIIKTNDLIKDVKQRIDPFLKNILTNNINELEENYNEFNNDEINEDNENYKKMIKKINLCYFLQKYNEVILEVDKFEKDSIKYFKWLF